MSGGFECRLADLIICLSNLAQESCVAGGGGRLFKKGFAFGARAFPVICKICTIKKLAT